MEGIVQPACDTMGSLKKCQGEEDRAVEEGEGAVKGAEVAHMSLPPIAVREGVIRCTGEIGAICKGCW